MEIKLFYREEGSGEPLILLHGNGEDSTYFDEQIAYFKKSYCAIALDTRGHGKSARGTANFCIRQFAEDLHDFMEEKKIKKANILGFSDGANIALIFAMRYPEYVKKLILNGANLKGDGVKPTVQIPIIVGYRMASLFARVSSRAAANAEMLGLMVHDPNIEPSELKKVKVRTLVIAGTKDMIKEEHTRQIYGNLSDAELVLIEGNHFVAKRNPEAFNKAVEIFLKEKDGKEKKDV